MNFEQATHVLNQGGFVCRIGPRNMQVVYRFRNNRLEYFLDGAWKRSWTPFEIMNESEWFASHDPETVSFSVGQAVEYMYRLRRVAVVHQGETWYWEQKKPPALDIPSMVIRRVGTDWRVNVSFFQDYFSTDLFTLVPQFPKEQDVHS